MFRRATKKRARIRLALIGPAGAGKTYTSLRVAAELAGEVGKIALIDTERSSASNYANLCDFDVCDLEDHDPRTYIEAIQAAAEAGYDALIIDSLSHAWMGRGGALEQVDKAAKRSRSGNSFAAWRDVTPLHHQLVDALLSYPGHVIATMRAKMAYAQEQDSKGRTQIRKLGLQPLQRDGLEYEFDIVGDMDTDNNLVITKTRCPELREAVILRPGADFAQALLRWSKGHDPSWTDKERRGFCARMKPWGGYDAVAAACEAQRWGRPAGWQQPRRDSFHKQLCDGKLKEQVPLADGWELGPNGPVKVTPNNATPAEAS